MEPLRLVRTRTLIYAAVLLVVFSAMATALMLRPRQELFAQHDRAPLFVVESDGSVRDGYSVSVSNKTLHEAHFVLRVDGVADARLRLPEGGAAATAQPLTVAADSVGIFRVLVSGQPAGTDQAIDFTLSNPATGVRTVYRSVFLGPVR